MDCDATTRPPARRLLPTTRTALVRMAQQEHAPEHALAALGELCVMYYEPLSVLIRGWSYRWAPGEAADLTHAFMASLLRYGVATFDPTHGGRRRRFRSWLLRAVENFLNNERTRRCAGKRDQRRTESLDGLSSALRSAVEPREARDPERAFHGSFAACLLDRAFTTTREWYAARGDARRFDLLERFIPGDEISDLEYEPAAAALGISVGAVRKAVMDLRLRYQAQVRAHVREIVGCEADVDGELRCLFAERGDAEER